MPARKSPQPRRRSGNTFATAASNSATVVSAIRLSCSPLRSSSRSIVRACRCRMSSDRVSTAFTRSRIAAQRCPCPLDQRLAQTDALTDTCPSYRSAGPPTAPGWRNQQPLPNHLQPRPVGGNQFDPLRPYPREQPLRGCDGRTSPGGMPDAAASGAGSIMKASLTASRSSVGAVPRASNSFGT